MAAQALGAGEQVKLAYNCKIEGRTRQIVFKGEGENVHACIYKRMKHVVGDLTAYVKGEDITISGFNSSSGLQSGAADLLAGLPRRFSQISKEEQNAVLNSVGKTWKIRVNKYAEYPVHTRLNAKVILSIVPKE